MQVNLARTLAARGDISNAVSILEAEIANNATGDLQERAALLHDMARLYVRGGRFSEGAKAYLTLAETISLIEGQTSPSLSATYELASEAFMRAGDLENALAYLNHALEVDRRYLPCDSIILVRALLGLANLNEQTGRGPEADRLRHLASDENDRCADEHFNDPTPNFIAEDRALEATQSSFTQIPVYYATDRARTGSMRPDTFYGGERGNLEFGVLDITIPRSHKPGNIEAPSLVLFEWSQNPDRHIVIKRLETLEEGEIMARMRAALEQRGSDEAFVFVHGYNVTFADAAKRTAQIAYDLNFEGIPFVYSWPSLGSPFGYISDEAVVRLGGRRLMAILDSLVQNSGVASIHLIAHSMGSRALADALELMAMRHTGSPASEPQFEQVLFAAPDVDVDLFSEMTRRFRPLTRRLTLYASDRDSALETSRSLHGEKTRAGEAGKEMLVSKAIDTIDMSALGNGMLGHSYFANDTSALSDILWLFWRDDDPSKRCGMKEYSSGNGVHWRYDTTSCNSNIALSALTLLRAYGPGALEQALSHFGGNPDDNTIINDEWRAIADVIQSALGG